MEIGDKVKIIKVLKNTLEEGVIEYYSQFIGKTYCVIGFWCIHDKSSILLPIQSFNGKFTETLWIRGEYKIVKRYNIKKYNSNTTQNIT